MAELKRLTLLVVEDEDDLRRETAAFLGLYYERVLQAADGNRALALVATDKPDLVISDIRMPAMDGLELAARLKKQAPDTPLIFCTAFTETAYLLKAIELGVAAFIRKPIDTDELQAAIDKAAVPVLQRREINGLSAELAASLQGPMRAIPAQLAVTEQALRVARTGFSVLLEGETGSGKSRLASIIHNLSMLRRGPFVTVQLGALPQHLAESELFGHIKGAFTGADRHKAGLVESAQGGTLFLDDIESAPPALQAKLLRFVEEKKFTPVGSTTEKSVNLRVITASNHDLKREAKAGRFREDLYYRLADVTIALPSLRSMPEAIVPLAIKFLHETCDELGRDLPQLDEAARALLTGNCWPGNIRQLKSVIRRAALSAGGVIGESDIAAAMGSPSPARAQEPCDPATSPPPFPCSMDQLERWSLEQALRFCGGKRMKTAMMLGMNYYTFRRRLERHGLSGGEE